MFCGLGVSIDPPFKMHSEQENIPVGGIPPAFLVPEGVMMSLPVWSRVFSIGYDVISCLVPCYFSGVSGPGCLVLGSMALPL